MSTNTPIPSFKHPPLTEVYLSIQFNALEAFNIATYGQLWDEFKEQFPRIEHHRPLDPHFEKIGGRRPMGQLPGINIEPIPSAYLPRSWFLNDGGDELLQIQPDRVIRNWRRLNPSHEYPRYNKHMRPEFIKNIQVLNTLFEKYELGKIEPNQCEISYINTIDAGKAHGHLHEVFNGWSAEHDLSGIAEVEHVNIGVRHVIRTEDGEFLGRMYTKVQPAFTSEGDKPVFLIELTVKGRPLSADIDSALQFMDIGREKIVRAFTAMTTPEMHRQWKREY